jgi:hypothetical protein
MAVEVTHFGMEGTGDWTHPDYRPKNYRQAAFELFPDSPSPFTYILSKLPESTTDDPEFKLFEWRLPKQTCIVQGTLVAGTGLLEVDTLEVFQSGDGAAYANEGTTPARAFKAGDILRVEDPADCSQSSPVIGIKGPELMVVASITDADTMTVYRYWGSTNVNDPTGSPTYGTVADGSVLRWAGSVYNEGSLVPTSLTKRASIVSNYTGIFKDSVKITGTAEQMKTRPYKPWPQFKGECLERHMMKLEWALLNGVPYETTAIQTADYGSGANDAEYARTTGGFRYFVEQAQGSVDFSAGVDIDTIEDEMEVTFTYGSKEKAGVSGYRALNILNKMVRTNSTWNWSAESLPKKQTYGLEVFQLRCPFGTLNIIPHKLLAESAQQTQDVLIIDTKYVEYVSMKGRDTAWTDNVQLPGEDARKGFYMTECGLRLALPEVHAVWTGLSALA